MRPQGTDEICEVSTSIKTEVITSNTIKRYLDHNGTLLVRSLLCSVTLQQVTTYRAA